MACLVALVSGAGAQGTRARSSSKTPAAELELVVPLARAVDDVIKGSLTVPEDGTATWVISPSGLTPAAEPVAMAWRHDYLKSAGRRVYVPFTIAIDPKLLPSTSVVAYLRVVAKGTTPAAGAAVSQGAGGPAGYAYEDYYIAELKSGGSGQPSRLSRAFEVPGGEYDVLFALSTHPSAQDKRRRDASPAESPVQDLCVITRRALTIPDLWTIELQTSSVLLADRIDALSTPPAGEARRERPYVIGATELQPVVTPLRKTQDLTVFLQVYNAVLDQAGRPDVSVEYEFFVREGSDEKPFNSAPAQRFNARSLPPNFDAGAGHQVTAGFSVPLKSFPVGEYRLAIKVADQLAGRSVERTATFTVAGS